FRSVQLNFADGLSLDGQQRIQTETGDLFLVVNGGINLGGGSIQAPGELSISSDSLNLAAGSRIASTDGNLRLFSDQMALNGSLQAGGNQIQLSGRSSNRPIILHDAANSCDAGASLCLDTSQLAGLSVNQLEIGQASNGTNPSGGIQLAGSLNRGSGRLRLLSGNGGISQSAGSSIGASVLAVGALGDISLQGANQVSAVVLESSQGNIGFSNLGSFSLTEETGLDGRRYQGVQALNGSVTLTSVNGGLDLTQSVRANGSSGQVNLNANSGSIQGAGLIEGFRLNLAAGSLGSAQQPLLTRAAEAFFTSTSGDVYLRNNSAAAPGTFSVWGDAGLNVQVSNYGTTIVPSGRGFRSGGWISLTANSPLIIDGDVSAEGDILLTAADPGDMTIAGTIKSTSGKITLDTPGGSVSGNIPPGAFVNGQQTAVIDPGTLVVDQVPVADQTLTPDSSLLPQDNPLQLAALELDATLFETTMLELAALEAAQAELAATPEVTEVLDTELLRARLEDQFPPAGELSGIPLPVVSEVGLLEAIAQLYRERYTPEDRARFYDNLSLDEVVASLRASGEDLLADFFSRTAAAELTNEAQLMELLNRPGISSQQRVAYLGVFLRMRHLAMTNTLAAAINQLKQNPDAADVFDDGKQGGPMEFQPAQEVIVAENGLALFEGRVLSESKLLNLRIDGRWAFIDENGYYKVTLPVKQGEHPIKLEASDPSGLVSSFEVLVKSDVDGKPLPFEGKRIAVVIGVEEYDNAIPELETPVNDARTIAQRLQQDQGFEPVMLENPSKQEIIDALQKLSREVGDGDQVMVYYAGHGYMLKETGRGYWLPRDADPQSPDNWVSNRDIARIFHRTPSKQIMLVSDSCYSGAFTRGGSPEELSDPGLARLRAVMGLSSGGEQPVWDGGGDGHSIFARKLLDSLGQGEIRGLALYQQVRNKVGEESPQVPGYGAMLMPGYDDNADYVLR
ncbi:MAG: caspase family protein, partial [Gammaproteobacteria bacterium]|nr:caspase family protein [Gammaproteobacteria bacterium]